MRFTRRILIGLAVIGAAVSPAAAQDSRPESRPASRPASEWRTETEADRRPKTHTGGSVLIRNAHVITASHGELDRASILVKDGKIAAIGADLEAPAGVTVIDAEGLWVMPGIIDCHSHIAITGGVNEGTTSISAEVRIGDVLDPADISIYRALAGGTTTAHILHGSANVIGGQDAVIKLRWGKSAAEMRMADAPQGIKFALGENPKRSQGRYPNTRLGVEAVLRRAFTEAREYRAGWDAYAAKVAAGDASAEAPRRDLRLETLVKIMKGEILVHSHCYRADEILMLMRVAEDFGFRIATLQHVLEGYKIAPEIAAHGAGASTFSDWWAYKIEAYDATPYNAALMSRAGIVVSLNSDSNELDRRLYLETAKAMKYGGAAREEAIRMVTLNAAKQLRIDGKVGSIDVGKDADLAIFSADPMSVYTTCVMTLIDGEVYFDRPRASDGAKPAAAAHPFTAPVKAAIEPLPATDAVVHAIRGATIHPVSAAPIENGVIVWKAGRILAVGGPDTAVPEGAEVTDGAGLSIWPGMIDAGTTLGVNEIGSITETQDTDEMGRIQPDLIAATALNPESEHLPVARVNGITTAVIAPNGGLISGQASLIRLDGWTTREMTVVPRLALSVNFPSSGGRRFGSEAGHDDRCACDDLESGAPPFEPDEVRSDNAQDPGRENEALKSLRDVLREAKDYARRRREAREKNGPMPAEDLRLAALVPYAEGTAPVIIDVTTVKDIRAAVTFAADNGLKICLRGAMDAWKCADELAARRIPVILGPVIAVPRDEYEPYDAPYASAAVLARAGVPFCLQTAAASDVRNLPYQAGMAAAYGLDRDLALRSVTLSAAEILGVEKDLGSLDSGKVADFVVTRGDLLEIRTPIVRLVIAGHEVPLDTRHTRLYEKYRARIVK